MSALQRMVSQPQHQGPLSAFESGSKKKFGKNLNKLHKPPAPPIANAGSNRGNGASSRNGLLLLSTKRSTSTGAPSSSGLLANKAPNKPPLMQPLGATRSDSYTSAHDALLDAVMGATRSETQKEPDAWGVAEKQVSTSPKAEHKAPLLAPNGGITSFVEPDAESSPFETVEPGGRSNHADNIYRFADQNERRLLEPVTSGHQNESEEEEWSRYNNQNSRVGSGHESNQTGNKNFIENVEEDQVAYMSRLARDRAEKRRSEEEARLNEQKERAARRLRELEEKMALDNTAQQHSQLLHGKPSIMHPEGNAAVSKSPVVLEKLGGKSSGGLDSNDPSNGTLRLDRNSNGRTLFDPNRTYSSLVGGSAPRNGIDQRREQSPAKPAKQLNGLNVVPAKETVETVTAEENSDKLTKPVIQLSSYEDRDRGERNSNAGPRMLFDPKSGSMVAVTPKDESSKSKKGKPKGRPARDASSPRRMGKNDSPNDVPNGKSGKKAKGRKEDTTTPQKKERRRGDSTDATSPADDMKTKTRTVKTRPAERRLPRTRGVLYVRDDKGNCYCSDGCEGDQGYGSHSVRGGRVRNPVAHAKFLEEHHSDRQNGHAHSYGLSYYDDEQTGPNGQTSARSPDLSRIRGVEQKVDWVKPDDKIELLTGAPDSPTLQATAVPWAPSQAALAAAAAAKEKTDNDIVNNSLILDGASNHTNQSDEADDEDSDTFIGLGFDPTENMDAVIGSPSLRADTTKLDAVDLAVLSLEPAAEATSRNIFAFGSSATWGSTGGDDSGDWAIVGPSKRSSKPASFLSLSPSNNTWGGLPGLSGGQGKNAD